MHEDPVQVQPQQAKTKLTVEEYRVSGRLRATERIAGEIVEVSPTHARHGQIAARLARLVGNFVDERNLRELFTSEAGFVLQTEPAGFALPLRRLFA